MPINDGHRWQTQSLHRTSDGVVRYQSCHCGMWRLTSTGAGAGIVVTVPRARRVGRAEEDR